jgi:hypothetical protein
MRTKTILLAAALSAAGIGVSVAQSPVYSVNAVGYVTKNLTNGYNLISNPLNGTNNLLSTIIPVITSESYILRWNPANQSYAASVPTFYEGGFGWIPDEVISPGEGFFLFSTAPGNTNVTFVGEVPQGNLTNSLAGNYSLVSHIVPQSISLAAAGVGLPAQEEDYVLFWSPVAQSYAPVVPTYYGDPGQGGFGWLPSEPTPAVAEGFFYHTGAAAGRNWTRTFSVN